MLKVAKSNAFTGRTSYTVTRESSFSLDPVQLDASLGSSRLDIFCAQDVCSLAIQLTHSGRKMRYRTYRLAM